MIRQCSRLRGMRIRILDSALDDLDRGRVFYDRQGEGLGGYFMDSLFSEIDSLVLYAGIHRKVFGFQFGESGTRFT